MLVVFPVEDAEYMIMSCPSSSPSKEQIDTPGTGKAGRGTQSGGEEVEPERLTSPACVFVQTPSGPLSSS